MAWRSNMDTSCTTFSTISGIGNMVSDGSVENLANVVLLTVVLLESVVPLAMVLLICVVLVPMELLEFVALLLMGLLETVVLFKVVPLEPIVLRGRQGRRGRAARRRPVTCFAIVRRTLAGAAVSAVISLGMHQRQYELPKEEVISRRPETQDQCTTARPKKNK